MQEIAEYQIDGRVYTQTFLSIQQTIQVTKIIKGMKFENFDIPEILETLVNSGKLQALLEIVLNGEKPIYIDKIKPALLVRMIGDFFSFNELLDIISSVSDMLAIVNDSGVLPSLTEQMKGLSQTGTNSSPPPPMETSPNIGISGKKSISSK
jgi:hypothetical protein